MEETAMEDVLLVIQRTSDGYVLCSHEIEEGNETLNLGWFSPDRVPDEYGYIIIRENQLHALGCVNITHQNKILPKIVADCTQEYYAVGQLRFLRLSEESLSEFPTMLQ